MAVAAPPLIDWQQDHRETVDRLISRASGTEAKTEGAIDIRLLPTPLEFVSTSFAWVEKQSKFPNLNPPISSGRSGPYAASREAVPGNLNRSRADINVFGSPDGKLEPFPPDLEWRGPGREWAHRRAQDRRVPCHYPNAEHRQDGLSFAENVSIEGQNLIGPGASKAVRRARLSGC